MIDNVSHDIGLGSRMEGGMKLTTIVMINTYHGQQGNKPHQSIPFASQSERPFHIWHFVTQADR
ncbi:hypothetical protein [Paenibacillus larvae]|uniref:hypothetical protein n=1 Tax=Paenibacillus larvae TaxID=1464 RepID=UPI00293EDA13|nr:hypothetical protein [Paenibacillus larvae]